MILDVIRQAWRSNPVLVVLSVPLAIAAVYVARLVLVVLIVTGSPA